MSVNVDAKQEAPRIFSAEDAIIMKLPLIYTVFMLVTSKSSTLPLD